MSSTTHTDNRKSGRYKTLVLVIGVLVALVIGLTISASAFGSQEAIETGLQGGGGNGALSLIMKVLSNLF